MFTETTQPILANFQCGVTDEFLQYFWSLKWPKEQLNEDENAYLERFGAYKVMFVQGSEPSLPELDPTQPTLVILRNPPETHTYLMNQFLAFANRSTEHRLMIVGDVSLMLKLQPMRYLWLQLSLTYFLVTMHDRQRFAPFHALTMDILAESAGIPSLTLQILRKEQPSYTDPIFFWVNSPSNIVREMALRFFVTCHTTATVNIDWSLHDINMLDLARACGYLVAKPSVAAISTPNSPFVSLDGEFSVPNSPHVLVWPSCLIEPFKSDCNGMVDKLPKDVEVGWLLLEQLAMQNMAKRHGHEQTLGERFPFLATSFVSQIKHEISDQYIRMPQIKESVRSLPAHKFSLTDFKTTTTMNSQDFWMFIRDDVVPANQPLTAQGDNSATSDWMVKLVNGEEKHLLCFQLKSGDDEYSFEQILDELAKCPQVEIASKAYAYREVIYHEAGKHGFKLTFVFGSMSHAKVKDALHRKQPRLAPSNSSVLRVTHESWQKVPENVEIIILLESGLRSLGMENYKFIKNYNANAVLSYYINFVSLLTSCFVVTALNTNMSHANQNNLSAADVKNLIEAYASQFSEFDVTVDVARKTSSPGHERSEHGVKRPLEDSDDEDASARKKSKTVSQLSEKKDT